MIFCLSVAFVFLAVLVTTGALLHFDTGCSQWISGKTGNPALTSVMRLITGFGNPTSVVVLSLLLLAIRKIRMNVGVPVAFSTLAAAVMNPLLKNLFHRIRPDILHLTEATGYSFPSGHAMVSAALYTALLLETVSRIRSASKRIAASAGLIAAPFLVGLSRLYLGVHYLSDVAGGWILGVLIACGITNFYPRILKAKE